MYILLSIFSFTVMAACTISFSDVIVTTCMHADAICVEHVEPVMSVECALVFS